MMGSGWRRILGKPFSSTLVAQQQEWRWRNIMIDDIFGALFMDDLCLTRFPEGLREAEQWKVKDE